MAKDHNLPAGLLSELDNNLEKSKDQPWTASVIKQVREKRKNRKNRNEKNEKKNKVTIKPQGQ